MDDDPDQLLSMFMSLGTTDHGALIDQFKRVVKIDDDGLATFFLEANNWNLQGAVWSYFEQGASSQIVMPKQQPHAELIGEMTQGDTFGAGQRFTKIWRLRNSGSSPWPQSTVLQFVQGDRMGSPEQLHVPPLAPGETTDVSATFVAPQQPGQFVATWRLQYNEGVTQYFGDDIWVILNVTEEGGLDIVQAMQSFTTHDGGAQEAQQQPQQQQPPQQQSMGMMAGGQFGSGMQHQQMHMQEGTGQQMQFGGGQFGGGQMQLQQQGGQQQQQQQQQGMLGQGSSSSSSGMGGGFQQFQQHHHHHQ